MAFTLIEVLTALAIISFVLLALLEVRNGSSRSLMDSSRRAVAVSLARNKMEEIRSGSAGAGSGRFERHPEYAWLIRSRKITVRGTDVTLYELGVGYESVSGLGAVNYTLMLPPE